MPEIQTETAAGAGTESRAAATGSQAGSGSTEVDALITTLGKKVSVLDSEIEKTREGIKVIHNLIVGVTVAVAIAFVVVAIDYINNNYVRYQEFYEKFMDKTIEVQKNIYTKNEVDSMWETFKDCVRFNGLPKCLK
ncbi:MAG: hypothetical protein HYY10_03815 [Candidatus Liptonbacteria bacterium]|nr:hypothetical protein [Candidatus Liptonbacteria bacterium]